ncbi:hypothetical protein FRC12_001621 [Ceratobasidium sp. 428]|nr:hypothetical protein FRC12_001621 [Ceratobasidium sp. 428]
MISGCSPSPPRQLQLIIETKQLGPKLQTALELLKNPDESEGQGAMSLIGLFDGTENDGWREKQPQTLQEALALPEERIVITHGCSMGGNFHLGSCTFERQGVRKNISVAYGGTFYVLTTMLPILDAATGGRVTPYRLWRLVISRGFFQGYPNDGVRGVDYGLVEKFWDYRPLLFGDIDVIRIATSLENLGDTPEEIAWHLRDAGYWVWMRPDRFPIDEALPSHSARWPFTMTSPPTDSSYIPLISQLPPELILHLCSEMSLSDIVALAETGKTLYNQLIGTQEARDNLAKMYMYSHARWCLPYGETELKWWNDRNGDDTLGWDYMRRCYTDSYSMRNRRRIWQVAESIEDECKKEEAGISGEERESGCVDAKVAPGYVR